MKRITPDEVLAAYKATGLKPARYLWYTEDNGGCACAMGALIAWKYPGELEAVDEDDIEIKCDDISSCDWGLSYSCGFVTGFDSGDLPSERSEEWQYGFDDGCSAAAAVFGGAA